MTYPSFSRPPALLIALAAATTALLWPLPSKAQLTQPYWDGYGGNAQHTALASTAVQPLDRIRWQTPVDRRPERAGAFLLIHYGSPIVTQANTVILPVKRRLANRFGVEGRRASDGRRLWSQSSNYRLPPHSWTPTFSPVLAATGKLFMPAGGGTVAVRTQSLDTRGGARRQRVTFYGDANYRAHRHVYMDTVFINTPITADSAGTIFFGFQVTGANPLGLTSGIARIADDGTGTWVSAAAAANDTSITKVAHNSAPALSNDGQTLYVAVNDGNGFGVAHGNLLALNSTTLATVAAVRLWDPLTGQDAAVNDNGTASPTVGPDGHVYFGVLDNPLRSNNFRGWLLHFNGALQPHGAAGAFGWDDTASIVPAAMVPSYAGTSAYLVMTKYNNYAFGGGDGVNRLAVLDPNDQMIDPISGVTVMREVLTVAGPTPDDLGPAYPNAVREWCINTAAVDPVGKSIVANNEDGSLYRWDMTTGTLAESIVLASEGSQAYTPTVIGPDGTVYAIYNSTLFAVGSQVAEKGPSAALLPPSLVRRSSRYASALSQSRLGTRGGASLCSALQLKKDS